MNPKPFISVVCPVYNEERFIDGLVQSIINQDYPKDRMEVLIVDGRSCDKTKERVESYIWEYPFISLYDNPLCYVPHALNIGIENARGEVVIRLDAHCVYPSDYFSVLVQRLFELDADNVGGVWRTVPADGSDKALAVAVASSNSFGVGNSFHKTGIASVRQVDTVPFGCFKRDLFDRIGFFDEELIRNQDDEFNARIIQAGGRIFLLPELEITYTARGSLSKIAKTYFQYGLFKPLVNKKIKHPATLRQFVPVLFAAGLIFGLPLSVFLPFAAKVYAACFSLYVLVSLLVSLRQAVRHRNPVLFFLLPLVFFLMHFCYGCGYWKGLWKIATGGKFSVGESR
ncbi:MAG: glycosyltransferase family 2 protein [Bacteroides sp.]|nr:glycosyltransferase family 2 protein [Ruminococcus flavefaciens]MCM1555229.1 glycosyltransferase family 2 protein [Bacteroides sp.]